MRSLVGVEQPLQLCVVSVYKSTGYTTDQIVCAFYLVTYLVKIAFCMGFFRGILTTCSATYIKRAVARFYHYRWCVIVCGCDRCTCRRFDALLLVSAQIGYFVGVWHVKKRTAFACVSQKLTLLLTPVFRRWFC